MKRQTNENLNTPSAYDDIFSKVVDRDKDFDRTVDRKHKVILEKFNGGKLIDIGCLNSPLCLMAKEKFPDADITLLDFSPKVIDFFNKNYGFKTILADCRNIPVPDNTFDYAVAEEVLEHLENPEELIKEAIRILKPGGVFAVSTPYDESNNACGGGFHIWSFLDTDIKSMFEKYGEAEVNIFTRGDQRYYIVGYLKKLGSETH